MPLPPPPLPPRCRRRRLPPHAWVGEGREEEAVLLLELAIFCLRMDRGGIDSPRKLNVTTEEFWGALINHNVILTVINYFSSFVIASAC
jgi:hypothetical protein